MKRFIFFLLVLSGSITMNAQTVSEKLDKGAVEFTNGYFFVYGISEGRLGVKKYDASLELKAEYSKGVRSDSKEGQIKFGWEGKNIVIFIPYTALFSEGLFIRLTENLKEISITEMPETEGKAERKRAGYLNLELSTVPNDTFDFQVDDGKFIYGTKNFKFKYWPRFEKAWETSLNIGKTDDFYSMPMFLEYKTGLIVYYSNENVGKGYQQFLNAIDVKERSVLWRTELNTAPTSVWSPSSAIVIPSGQVIIAGSYCDEDPKQNKLTNSMGETYGLAHMKGGFLMKLDKSGKTLGTKTFDFSQSREGLPGKYEKDLPLARVHSITYTSKGTYMALIEEFCYAGKTSTKDQLKEGFGGPEYTFVTLGFTQIEFNDNLEIINTITTNRKDFESLFTTSPGIPPGPSSGMDCYRTYPYTNSSSDYYQGMHSPTLQKWTHENGESIVLYRDFISEKKARMIIIKFSGGVAQTFEFSPDIDFSFKNGYRYWIYITGAKEAVICKLEKESVVLTRKTF